MRTGSFWNFIFLGLIINNWYSTSDMQLKYKYHKWSLFWESRFQICLPGTGWMPSFKHCVAWSFNSPQRCSSFCYCLHRFSCCFYTLLFNFMCKKLLIKNFIWSNHNIELYKFTFLSHCSFISYICKIPFLFLNFITTILSLLIVIDNSIHKSPIFSYFFPMI